MAAPQHPGAARLPTALQSSGTAPRPVSPRGYRVTCGQRRRAGQAAGGLPDTSSRFPTRELPANSLRRCRYDLLFALL